MKLSLDRALALATVGALERFDGTTDGLAAIKSGTLKASIAPQPAKLGQMPVEQITKILKGEKVEAPVPAGTVTVNKTNVGDFSK